ncbi:MAG: hypothetical protein WCP45_08725 [Verrucomicrobiota bacterium]
MKMFSRILVIVALITLELAKGSALLAQNTQSHPSGGARMASPSWQWARPPLTPSPFMTGSPMMAASFRRSS